MSATPLEDVARAHVQAWLDLATSTAAVASLPVRTLQHLVGWEALAPGPATADLLARLADAEAAAAAARQDANRFAARLADVTGEHQALVGELRRAYAALEQDVAARIEASTDDQKRLLYQLLEPLLTQLPVVRRAIAQGLPVEAADVVALLAPLDEALARLGITPIGEVGADVAFDPALHQANGTAPEAGTAVTVKHVGYKLDTRLLRKARVAIKG